MQVPMLGPYEKVMALKTEMNNHYIQNNCKDRSLAQAKAELKNKFGDIGSPSQPSLHRPNPPTLEVIAQDQQFQNQQQITCYHGITSTYRSLYSIYRTYPNFQGESYEELIAYTKWLEGRPNGLVEEDED
ncbi:unnamed protein product [Lupinus luteus]|uniref:Uncharacterized protein n=1 Tax=Lupinus luteus TaxID=3873 RepID=A0AAV1YAH1_LUPLU